MIIATILGESHGGCSFKVFPTIKQVNNELIKTSLSLPIVLQVVQYRKAKKEPAMAQNKTPVSMPNKKPMNPLNAAYQLTISLSIRVLFKRAYITKIYTG